MALPRQPCTDVAPAQWQSATVMQANVHVHRRGVPFRAERRVAPPRQSCADVAQAEWKSTTVVPPPCACAAMSNFRAPAWPWCILQANIQGTMAGSAPGAPPTSVTPRAEVAVIGGTHRLACRRRTSPSRLGTVVVSLSRLRAVSVHVS